MKEAYIFCNANYIKPETRKTMLCKDAHLGGKTMKKKWISKVNMFTGSSTQETGFWHARNVLFLDLCVVYMYISIIEVHEAVH